jgi:hypothetical protein
MEIRDRGVSYTSELEGRSIKETARKFILCHLYFVCLDNNTSFKGCKAPIRAIEMRKVITAISCFIN